MKTKSSKNAAEVKAFEIMSTPVITIDCQDSMRQAAALMLDKKISGLAVLDSLGRPIGTLTKTDIARYERTHSAVVLSDNDPKNKRCLDTLESVAQYKNFHEEENEEERIAYWMMPNFYHVYTDDPIALAMYHMTRKHMHHIFVIGAASEKLAGIITTFDIMRYFSSAAQGKLAKSGKI